MSDKILVIGESGSGKTRSLYSLDPKETFYINVIGKALPFQGWKTKYVDFNRETKEGNMVRIHESDRIINALKFIDQNLPHVKIAVIDDAQYIMAYEFMERAMERGFDKFTEIGKHMFDLLKIADELRPDLVIVFLFHSDDVSANGYIKTKAKTIGKTLDEKITIEGLFTVILQAICYKDTDKVIKYSFVTKNNGTTTVKTPEGMFDSNLIENDLKFVIDSFRKYNS